jgi:hypothetical protein
MQIFLGLFETEQESWKAYEKSVESIIPLPNKNKCPTIDKTQPPNSTLQTEQSTADAKLLWGKLCDVYQRQLFGKTALAKLLHSQRVEPTFEKQRLLQTLQEEVVMLTLVRTQLEESMSEFFSGQIMFPSLSEPTSVLFPSVA